MMKCMRVFNSIFLMMVFSLWGTVANGAWDTGGVAVSTPVVVKSSVKQTTSIIGARVRSTLRTRPVDDAGTGNESSLKKGHPSLGLSAGDAPMGHGVWLNIGYNSIEDDNTVSESDIDLNTYILGYDFKLSDRMAIGVAVSFEQLDADLHFNNGKLEGDGYTLSPYFTMLLTDYLSMDIVAGYTLIDYDQDRDFGAVTSSLDADRQFFEYSLNSFHYFDQWCLSGNLGFIYAHETQDSYTESNGDYNKEYRVDFSQIFGGIEVAYTFKHLEPYFSIAYERDLQYDEIAGASYDESGGNGGIGCRFFFSDRFSGDIAGSTRFGRDDYDDYSILGNIRYDF